MLLAIGLRCPAKNMLKVTHKCQPSNRGTERLLLWYLPAWQWRSWHGSPVLIRPLIICLVIETRTGSFFRLRLIRSHIGTASLDATFRREFILPNKPAAAHVRLRALRRAEVKVNGIPIQLPQNRNWKNVSEVAIAEQLHEGTNIVEVRVFNHNGPPALWLVLSYRSTERAHR